MNDFTAVSPGIPSTHADILYGPPRPDLLPDDQLLALASTLAAKGVDNYVLQQFRAEGCQDAALAGRPLLGYPAASTVAQIGAMFPRFTFRNHGS